MSMGIARVLLIAGVLFGAVGTGVFIVDTWVTGVAAKSPEFIEGEPTDDH